MELSHSKRHQLARWWAWFALATLVAAVFVSLRFVLVAGPAGPTLAAWMRALSVVGEAATLVTALLLPVLLLAVLVPRPRLLLVVGTVVSSLLLILLLVDGQVYALYRFHLNPGVMQLVFGAAGTQIFVFSGDMWLQVLAIGTTVVGWQALVAIMLWRQAAGAHRPRFRGRIAAATLAALMLPYQLAYAWADAVGFTPLTRDASLLPLSYPFRARGLMRGLGFETRHDKWHLGNAAGGLAYPLEPVQCKKPATPPNIILIVIDSWRFDALDPKVTPRIWDFAQESARFSMHFSGGNATRAGIFSLFYGIPATYWHDMLQNRHGPVLISTLLKDHYQIGIFQSASLRSPEFNETVFAQVENPRLESDGDTPAARDLDLTADFEQFLAQRDPARPWFAFLFYDSPHAYDFPKDFPLEFQPSLADVNYLSLGRDSDPVPFHNRYLNAVHFTDTLVARVLDDLKASGTLDSAVIVMTGDHGQEFNDNGLGYWGHNSNFTRFQTQVPLIWHAPDIKAQEIHYRSSHFDVAPTLMSRYLGCTTAMDRYSVGHDLFQPGGRDDLVIGSYQDFAVVEPDRIVSVRQTGLEVLDTTGRPAPQGKPPNEAVSVAIEQNSRFHLRVPAQGSSEKHPRPDIGNGVGNGR